MTLHYITLHYTTLHYITLHYITLHAIRFLENCKVLMFFAHHEARGLGRLTFCCRSLVVHCYDLGRLSGEKRARAFEHEHFYQSHCLWQAFVMEETSRYMPKALTYYWFIIDKNAHYNKCMHTSHHEDRGLGGLTQISRCKTKSHMPLRFQNHMQSSTEFHMIALLHIFYGSTPMHLFEFLKLWTRTACFKNLHCFALWSYQRWRPICKSERINWPARLGRDGRFLDGDTLSKNKQTQKKKEHRKGRTNQRHVLYFLFVLSCISYPGMFPRCWMGPKTLRFLSASTLLQFKCRRTLFKLVQFALFESFKLAQVGFKWLQGCSLRINTLIELSERRS